MYFQAPVLLKWGHQRLLKPHEEGVTHSPARLSLRAAGLAVGNSRLQLVS